VQTRERRVKHPPSTLPLSIRKRAASPAHHHPPPSRANARGQCHLPTTTHHPLVQTRESHVIHPPPPPPPSREMAASPTHQHLPTTTTTLLFKHERATSSTHHHHSHLPLARWRRHPPTNTRQPPLPPSRSNTRGPRHPPSTTTTTSHSREGRVTCPLRTTISRALSHTNYHHDSPPLHSGTHSRRGCRPSRTSP
jgi:hypothetical protein